MKKFLKAWKKYLLYAGFFSLFINLFQLTFSIYMLLIYDKVLTSYSMPTLMVITVVAIGALVTMALLEFIRSRILVRMSVAMDNQMSEDVLSGMIRKSAFGGEQSAATLKDVSIMRNYLSGNAIFAFFDVPWTPIFIGLIFLLHPLLGWVSLGGALVIFLTGILQDRLASKPLAQANIYSNVSQDLVSLGMRNAEAVRSMGMLGGLTRRWHSFNDKVIELQTNASKSAGVLHAFTSAFRTFMQVAIYGVGAWLTLKGECSAGVMISASIIMGRGLAPIQQGMAAYKQTADAIESYKRLNAHFKNAKEKVSMELPAPTGDLSCEGISLVAPGGRYILQGVQFALKAGESMGLIGPSAAGKTTLCRMLIGLWPPSMGKVRLDGADVFAWDQEKLGKYIGYLPQDVELFSGTVADNIGRFEDYESEDIVEAAQKAGAHEMILRLPDGYDTKIGVGGASLSGGQRQRLGLARALYGSPKLVILDEPSSNLDEEGERILLQTLQRLKEDKATVIVVSHKMSTIATMDKLLVLHSGRVAQFGERQQVLQALQDAQQKAQQQMPKPKPAFPRPAGGVVKMKGN